MAARARAAARSHAPAPRNVISERAFDEPAFWCTVKWAFVIATVGLFWRVGGRLLSYLGVFALNTRICVYLRVFELIRVFECI